MAASRRKWPIGEHGLPLTMAGVAAWLIAALVVRTMPWVFGNLWQVTLACLAMIVAAEILVRFGGALLGIERVRRVAPAAWFAATLLICHAISLLFWPSLYGADETIVRQGSAWIVFAAACPILNARFWAERA